MVLTQMVHYATNFLCTKAYQVIYKLKTKGSGQFIHSQNLNPPQIRSKPSFYMLDINQVYISLYGKYLNPCVQSDLQGPTPIRNKATVHINM